MCMSYMLCCVHAVLYMRLCTWCSCGIMTCVFVMLYSMYVYVLCCTSGVGVCIVLCYTLGVGVCIVCKVYVHVLHVVCRVWLYVCDAHYVYVHVVEDKEPGVCQVWKPI